MSTTPVKGPIYLSFMPIKSVTRLVDKESGAGLGDTVVAISGFAADAACAY